MGPSPSLRAGPTLWVFLLLARVIYCLAARRIDIFCSFWFFWWLCVAVSAFVSSETGAHT